MEERRILLDEKVLHLPGAILGGFVFRWAVLRGLDLGLVYEFQFGSGLRVNDWREEGLGRVWHVEGKGLNVASDPGEGVNARRFGEG